MLVLRGRREEIPHLLYVEFRKLGGVYVKFLQLMIVQSDLFQNLRHYDLFNLHDVYDQVAYDHINIQELLYAEFGSRANELHIQQKDPFAAGSFGQVYIARYKDTDIVIKVLRPSVVKTLAFDLLILGWVSRFIDLLSYNSPVRITQLYKELSKVTRAETNYILEADYASTLYNQYKDHKNIFIPYTFQNFCTNRVICQEYVGGVAATDLLRVREQGIDPKEHIAQILGSDLREQLIALSTELLTGIFSDGVTYGDPHPGNIKFLPNNKIGFIDYGIQAPAPKNMTGLYRLVEQYNKIYQNDFDMRSYSQALFEMYGGDIIKATKSVDAYLMSDTKIADKIIDMAEQMLSEQNSRTKYLLDNNRMLALFGSVINKNNQFCLQYDIDSPEFMRAANLCIALVSELGMKKEVLKETYSLVLQNIESMQVHASNQLLHPETAFEILANWLDRISYQNPQLHHQITRGGLTHA